jgi:hypothetical protein
MPIDPKDIVLPLANSSITMELPSETRRFRVYTATLLSTGKRRVRLRFEGPKGSVILELPLVTFWQLTEVFHERSIQREK